MKYIVLTLQPTGNCWMTYTKVFDDKYEAIKYANENGGEVIETSFYYKGVKQD